MDKINNKKKPIISVIVPIYKVEKYIEKCINSIINQTYKNLEIILVDDGSPDNCPKICDEFAKKDKRIRVIHKENGGLSDARNAGLDIMTGDFVCFIDSDDWVESTYVEDMLTAQQNTDADIVACGVFLIEENTNNKKIFLQSKKNKLLKNNIFKYYYSKKNKIFCSAWNKLYKKEIFNEIRYPKGRIYEDSAIILKILGKCERVIVISNLLYNYLKRNESITGTNFDLKKLNSLFLNYEENLKYIEGKKNKKLMCEEVLSGLYNNYLKIIKQLNDDKLKKYLKNDFKEKWIKYKKYLPIFNLRTYRIFYLILKYKMLK